MTRSTFALHNHWQRLRWQIFWGVVAASAPLLIRFIWAGSAALEQGLASSLNAFWGGLFAIFFGILLIRNVGRYPGVERAAAIIPSFSASFGILIAILLMARMDYSRWALIGAYIGAICIFYAGYSQVFGRRRLKIGVVPFGDSFENLISIKGIDWVVIEQVEVEITDVDAIAADLRIDMPDEWEKRIADFALTDVPVYHSKHLIESLSGRVELEHLSETSYGTLSPTEAYMVSKHIVDRITAFIAIIVIAPLLCVVALLIRMDSPGPSIFRQKRIGFRGEPFTVYKFRTMQVRVVESAAALHDAITRTNDERITRFGNFLRRSRIDELPQIINILKGQMSWIGPRPEAAVLSKWYETEIPFYRYRHVVRPGVTGWAQVMQGHVADVDEVRSKLYYDFYYIKNFSLWIDSLIVFKTIATMINGFGSK